MQLNQLMKGDIMKNINTTIIISVLIIFIHLGISYCDELNYSEYPVSKITALDGTEEDYFGTRVSIVQDTVLVGAMNHDYSKMTDSGAAYIFKLTDNNNWVQNTKLIHSELKPGDNFGTSVSLSNRYAIVGAPNDDESVIDTGSVYIFKKEGEHWIFDQKIYPDDPKEGARFGISTAIFENILIVGTRNFQESGSVYIFTKQCNGWIQTQKILPNDPGINDVFGYSVGIFGDYMIVGSRFDDDKGTDSGSAYIFKNTCDGWIQVEKLLANDGKEEDYFGGSVSITDGYAIVGTWINGRNTNEENYSGAAYIFKNVDSQWIQQAKLVDNQINVKAYFGCSVAISNKNAIIGAYFDNINGHSSGSAYYYQLVGNNWILKSKLTPVDAAIDQKYGSSVSISNNSFIVAAFYDDSKGTNSGSAYIYDISINPYLYDSDNDGVIDIWDKCSNTQVSSAVNPIGCTNSELYNLIDRLNINIQEKDNKISTLTQSIGEYTKTIAELQSNLDSMVSKEEVNSIIRNLLLWDSNNDGKLGIAEIVQALQKLCDID